MKKLLKTFLVLGLLLSINISKPISAEEYDCVLTIDVDKNNTEYNKYVDVVATPTGLKKTNGTL